jgi:hypothetical protein
LHYLHNNVLVIDQSEYIEDRPVPGPFPAFPMTKREKPWERGWGLGLTNRTVVVSAKNIKIRPSKLRERKKIFAFGTMFRDNSLLRVLMKSVQISWKH